jgi:hypothetical protein
MICTCEKTMPLDARAIGHVCTGRITQANQLCGLDLDRYKAALADGGPITVACTQEVPRFNEVARDLAPSAALTFVNIRETGGWSKDAAAAGPKAAALIAAATEEMPPIRLVTLESDGVALIYGRDEVAIEVGQRLAEHLDVTVLLTKPGDVVPCRSNEFPVLKGQRAQRAWLSRSIRAHGRRLRIARTFVSHPADIRTPARRRVINLRYHRGSERRPAAVSRP